jgi:BolA protein
MEAKLASVFNPDLLAIRNDSSRHAGHAGAGEDTHFTVTLVSGIFEGMSRISRHQAVQQALAEEFSSGLHALSLRLYAPGEYNPVL